MRIISLALAAACAVPASANEGSERLRALLGESAAAMGVAMPEIQSVAVVPAGVELSTPPGGAREELHYEYPDVTLDLEDRSRYVERWVGKGRKRRRVPVYIDTGVKTANRVEQNQISRIVIHSSLGLAGDPAEFARREALRARGQWNADSCQSSVDFLSRRGSAAHFIVCRDGRVIQMADIKDTADHVKDPDFVANSVGIETDTGYVRAPYFYAGSNDWDPVTRWRLSVSLAKLIRMIHHATNGQVPLDRTGVRTHVEVDTAYCARARCSSHTDPGPYFSTEVLPAFGGNGMSTAEGNVMTLVGDNRVPRTTFISRVTDSDSYQVQDAVGLSKVTLWKLKYSRAQIQAMRQANQNAPVVDKVSEWTAAAAPIVMPPAVLAFPVPTEPGEYEVEARDLVGNRSYTDFVVAPSAPAQPLAFNAEMPSLEFASALSFGVHAE